MRVLLMNLDLIIATLKANLEKITEYAHLKNMIGIDEPPILEIIKENKMVRLELEKKALGCVFNTTSFSLYETKNQSTNSCSRKFK